MDYDERGKIFVGGLSWETTHENLMQYFSRFGEVVDCVVMKNSETGRSRGFGFVTFCDPTVVNAVLMNGPHTLDGRTIDPKPCNPRTLQKPKKGSGYPKVFLGGLSSNLTETDLRGFFSRYGKVMEVVIMYDQEKKKSRGFGFLSFETEDSVNNCVADHFVTLNGKSVEIKRAEPRNNTDGTSQSSQMGIISPSYNQVGSPAVNQHWGGVPNYQQGGYSGTIALAPQTTVQGWDAANSPAAPSAWGPTGYGVPPQPSYQQPYGQYTSPTDNWNNNWNQEVVSSTNTNNSSYMAAGDISTRVGGSNYNSAPPLSIPNNKQPPTGNYTGSEFTNDFHSAAGDNYVVGPVRVVGANYTYHQHPYRRA